VKRVAVLAALLAAAPALAREPSPGELKKRIEAVTSRAAFAAGWWGVEVRSLRSGKVLYAANAQRNFTPASTMKLVTTAAVLDALGPEATLRTTLETAGRLDAFGRILGDVSRGPQRSQLSGRFSHGRLQAGGPRNSSACAASKAGWWG
jgi:D-alanyl-D-alanine carboxypeptidase/D-alanyl-D-alanine-endopeptidase (penicillin-binding protein 4)